MLAEKRKVGERVPREGVAREEVTRKEEGDFLVDVVREGGRPKDGSFPMGLAEFRLMLTGDLLDWVRGAVPSAVSDVAPGSVPGSAPSLLPFSFALR